MVEQDVSGQAASTKQMQTRRIKAVLANLPAVLECISEWAREAGLGDRAIYEIQLAVDEACANIIHHAYAGMDPGEMEITCCQNEQVLTIRLRDWGQAFDPGSIEEPDVDASLEERSLGGLGLFLMKQVMDSVEFRFDAEQGNELVMIKRVSGTG
jgi:anti-sigma regulatory factor (Ser/Thr protein kinase)